MVNGDGEVPRRYSVVEEGGSYGDCEIGRGDRRTRRSYDGLSCGKLVGRRMRGVRISSWVQYGRCACVEFPEVGIARRGFVC